LQQIQARRLTRIIRTFNDTRDVPTDLRFLARTPIVPAADSEVMARFTGQVIIADLVANDQKAVTYDSGRYTFEGTAIPNIKHGRHLTQEMINHLLGLQASGVGAEDETGLINDYQNRTIDDLLLGVRQRMEALLVAMAIDGLSYNRLGIIMTNVTWGMPSDLKVTPAISWDNAGTATPVADLLAVQLTARVRYGQAYNRATMSTQAFRSMIATTEFQNKARMYLAPNVSFVNLGADNLEMMRTLAERVIGMSIELYDSRYWYQNPDGSLTSAPYLPIVKVVLSFTGDDNNRAAADFANAITTESVVAELGANTGIVGTLGGPQRGPIAYATVPHDLNPPNVTYWACARGFPRKHRLQSTAVLTVGTFADTIPFSPGL
jgi:hypothetical protein